MDDIKQVKFNSKYIIYSVIIVIGTIIGVLYAGSSPTSTNNTSEELSLAGENSIGENNMNEELIIEDMVVGSGDEAVSGKEVTVHYTGTLTDGTKFDSSLDRGDPFRFTLGAGAVIQGWDQGVAGMKVGGKRKLTIPARLGYGDRGAGALIPPGATLVFEVELLEVE